MTFYSELKSGPEKTQGCFDYQNAGHAAIRLNHSQLLPHILEGFQSFIEIILRMRS